MPQGLAAQTAAIRQAAGLARRGTVDNEMVTVKRQIVDI